MTYNVAKETTTEGPMASLARMYEKSSASNEVYLMKDNLKMQQGVQAADFLNELHPLTQQLSSVSLTFEDEVQALLLLSCLPDSWENMVMAVSNANGNEKLKLDSVIRAILDEEAKRASGYIESSGNALNVKARGRDQWKGKQRKHHSKSRGKSKGLNPNGHGEGKCFNCGLKGHHARDCRKPKVEDNSKGSANVAHNQSDPDVLLLSLEDKIDAWVIDSGALFHATSQRKMLNSYVKKDLGTVYLGDDEPSKISEKEDGELKLVNNTSLKLKDTRHVPKLKRNLISVGQLTDLGYKVTFEKESWKMSKGTVVVAHGKREGSLYIANEKIDALLASVG